MLSNFKYVENAGFAEFFQLLLYIYRKYESSLHKAKYWRIEFKNKKIKKLECSTAYIEAANVGRVILAAQPVHNYEISAQHPLLSMNLMNPKIIFFLKKKAEAGQQKYWTVTNMGQGFEVVFSVLVCSIGFL